MKKVSEIMEGMTICNKPRVFEPRHCGRCHELFTPATLFGDNCEPCMAVKRREVVEQRAMAWLSICPKVFSHTDVAKLPCPEQYEAVMSWTYQPTGLLLYGPTGKGKSRCAWLVMGREYMLGKTVRSMNALSGIEYAAKFSEGSDVVKSYLDKLCRVDLLFMDDIFKAKFTDSFEGAMFGVITIRTENELPIIVTANDTGATLAERMTEDRGAPLVRRLREYCETITFK